MLNIRNGLIPMIAYLVYWKFETSLYINVVTFILLLVKDKSLWHFFHFVAFHEKNV